MVIPMKYRNKLELYGHRLEKNELRENVKAPYKIKDVFCEIKPQHGGTKTVGNTQVEESYTIQRIFVRKLSIKEPKIDMYFKDSNGWKYEIVDFFPHYKNNAEWEFRTRINYE